jgi:hypothetical protein
LRIAVLGLLLALLPMAPASAATTITGTVTNTAGQGISNATVKISGFGTPGWTATTSDGGRYTIDISDLPGPVSVGATVTATGYAPSVSSPSQSVVPGPTARIDAVLVTEAIVEGTITGGGNPVAGATVQFQSGSLPPRSGRSRHYRFGRKLPADRLARDVERGSHCPGLWVPPDVQRRADSSR